MDKQLSLVAFLRAKPGREKEVEALLLSLVEPSRAEQACINYDMHQSDEDPCVFVMYENWASRAGLDAHFETPHLKKAAAALPDLLQAPMELHHLTMRSTAA
jgi:quinol monooxygenase YgiN